MTTGKIDRELWYESFKLSDIPLWKCPTCSRGILELNKKELQKTETVLSKSYHDEPEWDHEFITENFAGVLKCQLKKCGECIYITGQLRYSYEEVTYKDGLNDIDLVQRLYPKFFQPPLHLFDLGDELPSDVEVAIENAFSLFWVDKPACANATRKVVEEIMDDQRIRKTVVRNRKKRLGLHQRLVIFEEKNRGAAEILEAIKWIGNAGSHIGELDEDSLLDDLELLQHALEKIYGDHETRMQSLTQTINKRKGPE